MRRALRSAATVLAAAFALLAATPSPAPTPLRIDITKVQPTALLPKVPLHTEFIVDTNKMGQVTKIDSGKLSKDHTYNVQTMGNAIQTFIRTPDGTAVAGVYKLTYDYNPKTTRIHRDVAIVHPGGVDENAEGAANKLMDKAEKQSTELAPKAKPSVSNDRLPDLPQIMHSPHP